jgi:HK97 family phage portal protein
MLPWSSDGSSVPTIQNSWGDAVSAGLAIPAAWRAVNLIAGFVAQMPLRQMTDYPPVYLDEYSQLLSNPWPVIGYYNWVFGAVASIVLRGNFYAAKADFDLATGNPRQYIPIGVDDVTLEFVDGMLLYHVNGLAEPLTWQSMLHIRGFMMPGMLAGIGVIEAHRAQMQGIRTLMDYGTGAYAGGGVPPVVMRVDKPELSEQEAEYLQSRWVQRHSALDRRPAVIPKIVEIEKVGLSMQDAEYLQSRAFSIAEVAYMFNLDPVDLDATFGQGGGHLRYQNMEAKTRDRLIYSLQRWISPVEQAFDMDMPGNTHARFWTGELFRADSKSRMETYDIALRNDIYTDDEVREMEHLTPLTQAQKDANNPTPPQLAPFTGRPAIGDQQPPPPKELAPPKGDVNAK